MLLALINMMKMTDNTVMLSPSHKRQHSLLSEEPFLHTIIEMTQCIILRFFMLLAVTVAPKEVLSSAFKIKTALLSDSGGRFVLVILNAMRRRGFTTGSIEEIAYS